ncbi:hypothetical protein SAMN02745116_02340 [Pilibacter termitis]|uniref:Uncharacterized protein n=1 Tax=Pilibacter termitis TaxID=263852 RepID=A0A1T4QWT3_9ENTE|nr:hypothetical protein [Pilibacter termitis]SKA07778.1 hypothetical protein SAMN02745116_02340 [Pilibacter termitis]
MATSLHKKREYIDTILLYILEAALFYLYFMFQVKSWQFQVPLLFALALLKKKKLIAQRIKVFYSRERFTLKHSKENILEIIYCLGALIYFVLIYRNNVFVALPILFYTSSLSQKIHLHC